MVDIIWDISIGAIVMGLIGIGIAMGLNIYWKHKENQNRINNERFFVNQITSNLKKMTQYFLDVERKTTYNEEQETSNTNMINSLRTFYLRNEQEMKDILYQTKLYLPFWSSLDATDKQTIDDILGVFSWLLYDYYQSNLPESIRENTIINSRKTLYEKKDWMMSTTDNLLQKY